MEGVAFTQPPDVGEQGGTFPVPGLQIGGAFFLVGAAREDQVGDDEVADRPVVGRGLRIDLAGDAQRGFAEFPARSRVAGDGGVELAIVHHHGVIADGGAELVFITPPQQRERDDDERIGLGDEIAPRLQVGDLRLVFLDLGAEVAVPLDAQTGDRELFLVFLQLGFPSREERIRHARALRPPVAGEGLVELRHRDVVVELRPAVAVRPVRDHIHLPLGEEQLPPRARMLRLQDRLEIVEIVPREDLVDAGDVLLDAFGLEVVEMMKEGRDLGGIDEGVEILQHLREMGVDRGEFGGGFVRLRHRQAHLHLDPVAGFALALLHRGVARGGDHLGLHGDVAPEFRDIDLFPFHVA